MNIEEILQNHIDEDGKLNKEEAAKELKEVQGKEFVPKSEFNSKNEELKNTKQELQQRDNQLEELEDVNPEELQETISDLQQANKDLAEENEGKLKGLQVDHAVEMALVSSGAKNAKAVKALLELDDVELNKDGEVDGLSDQLDGLKESDDYLFNIENDEDKKKNVEGSPAGGGKGDDPTPSKKMEEMSYAELEAHLASEK